MVAPAVGGSIAWFVVRGSWFVVRGSWFVVRGSWFVVRGSWFVVRGSIPSLLDSSCKFDVNSEALHSSRASNASTTHGERATARGANGS
jgi:hypothetical protein